ncbi:hypothetical protein C7M84_004606 [Penaeus vannamei]|uniref:Uncharacterized protein n=1 Tax=Penaeus vannamei TaxID=6689 RepID=A0A3R7QSP6_PENVA|nr:hypothetical protein C7M84_004606 [Penaeus vannamei]
MGRCASPVVSSVLPASCLLPLTSSLSLQASLSLFSSVASFISRLSYLSCRLPIFSPVWPGPPSPSSPSSCCPPLPSSLLSVARLSVLPPPVCGLLWRTSLLSLVCRPSSYLVALQSQPLGECGLSCLPRSWVVLLFLLLRRWPRRGPCFLPPPAPKLSLAHRQSFLLFLLLASVAPAFLHPPVAPALASHPLAAPFLLLLASAAAPLSASCRCALTSFSLLSLHSLYDRCAQLCTYTTSFLRRPRLPLHRVARHTLSLPKLLQHRYAPALPLLTRCLSLLSATSCLPSSCFAPYLPLPCFFLLSRCPLLSCLLQPVLPPPPLPLLLLSSSLPCSFLLLPVAPAHSTSSPLPLLFILLPLSLTLLSLLLSRCPALPLLLPCPCSSSSSVAPAYSSPVVPSSSFPPASLYPLPSPPSLLFPSHSTTSAPSLSPFSLRRPPPPSPVSLSPCLSV